VNLFKKKYQDPIKFISKVSDKNGNTMVEVSLDDYEEFFNG